MRPARLLCTPRPITKSSAAHAALAAACTSAAEKG
jgi:hypothetical protein